MLTCQGAWLIENAGKAVLNDYFASVFTQKINFN